MAYRTYVKKSYPTSYHDPDAQAAAHLASAAWHLYEAGQDGLAVELTRQAVKLFENAKPDKTGAKKLGTCVYYPSGIIDLDGINMSIPAPKFDQAVQTDSAAVRKLAMDMCRPYLSWFASRQIAARLDGLEIPKIAASNRPARLLSQVQTLCGNYALDMPHEVTVMLSAKLDKLLERNTTSPMASSHHFDARYNRAENRYTFSLRYLAKSQLDLAMSHVDVQHGRMNSNPFRQDLMDSLRNMQALTWKGLPEGRPCRIDIDDMQRVINRASPEFFKAMGGEHTVSGWWITKTNILTPAMHAARETMNLILACSAFINAPDDYIRNILTKIGMADPDLEIQPDLPKKAAAIAFMGHVPEDICPNLSLPALTAFLDKVIDIDYKINTPEHSGRKDDT